MSERIVYRIRRKRDGLYSAGGGYPRWTAKGKVWSGRGPLTNHLNLVRDGMYAECEVVTVRIVEEEVSAESVDAVLADVDRRREEREARAREQFRRQEEREERQRLAELQAKYGGGER